MSQIFICYSHADKNHLTNLVAWLRDNGFSDQDLWYDGHIESGNNWRDEITKALDESFVVLVIVSRNSIASQYCTYEWAYAMGQGIPILPLIFDEVSIADVPTPLTMKQFVTCIECISVSLREQISRLRTVPPQIAAINRGVYNAIYDTHRRFFILGWVGDRINAFDFEMADDLKNYFVREAAKAAATLEALMTEKAFAFNGKQHRLCWKLADFLKEFSQLNYKYADYLQEVLFPRFEREWLPAFEYFEESGCWRKTVQHYFFALDLESNHSRMEVMTEMTRAFPFFSTSQADLLIQIINIDKEQEREGQPIPL